MPTIKQTFSGSVLISGSLTVTGSINATSFTGSLLGTSSYALTASVLAGGSLTNFIEGFSSATQATSFLSASNAAATVNIALVTKGTGSLLAQVPDGTTTGGNARGANAVDFQKSRTNANQVASADNSTILSGFQNRNTSPNSFLGGGGQNLITANPAGGYDVLVGGIGNSINSGNGDHVLVGGIGNTISSFQQDSVLVGGRSNVVSNTYVFLGGGYFNTVSGYIGVIGGGLSNTVSGQYSTISGGRQNTASNTYSTVAGGWSNTASGDRSFVGGGNSNQSTGQLSIIGAGYNNVASGTYDVIVGGYQNSTSFTGTGNESHRFIGGGESNVIGPFQNDHTTIVGGFGNTIYGFTAFAFIGGGGTNRICGVYSTLIGGATNRIGNGAVSTSNRATYCFLGGGQTNVVDTNSDYSSIVGGLSNQISGVDYAFIGGGGANTVSANYGTIGGGQSNTVSGAHGTIGGGQSNTTAGLWSTVGGGFGCAASANGAYVGGGYDNDVTMAYSGIGAGEGNRVTGTNFYAWIGGGQSNQNFGQLGTISGGGNNSISAGSSGCTIGGGLQNTQFNTLRSVIGGGYLNSQNPGAGNDNEYNTIAGGYGNEQNTNQGSYQKIRGGFYARTTLYGQDAHASGRFSSTGDAQSHELIWRRSITGTAQTELFLDGASVTAILPTTNAIWQGIIDIAAICSNAGGGTTVVGDVQATSYKVTIKRLNTTTTLVGTVQEIGTTNADASMITGIFTIDNNDTDESLRIQYTPPTTADGTTVCRVVATFKGIQIQY